METKMTSDNKRIIVSFGGKGGTGKSTFMVSLAEWFGKEKIPCTLLDLDTENKNRGSLAHFFNGSAPKINIRTQAGLDAFVDYLDCGPAALLCEMGPGSGGRAPQGLGHLFQSRADVGVP